MNRPQLRICKYLSLISVVLLISACSNGGGSTTSQKTENSSSSKVEDTQQKYQPKQWNILMIAVDDLNNWAEHLGFYHGAKTPNIDRLAADGMSFSQAFSAAPACNPSRTAFFTGVRPQRNGVTKNAHDYYPVLQAHEILPEYFAARGYKTYSTGKLFHTPFYNGDFFQTNYEYQGDYSSDLRMNGIDSLSSNFDWGPIDVEDDATPDFDKVNWASEQLKQDHESPFFMAVGIYRPHLPWIVPRKYFDMFPLEDIQLPKGLLENDLADVHPDAHRGIAGDHAKITGAGKWKEAIQAYLASTAYADAAIGRLYDALLNSKYADNTIVVLWGDHGWQLGEKERWRKFTLWAAGAKTSLIYKVPGLTKPGSIANQPVDLMSVYPTLLELTGLPKNSNNDGVSIFPILENPDIVWEHPAITTATVDEHSVRYKDWGYIKHYNGAEQLYNHGRDPYEFHNLIDSQTAEVVAIKAKLEAFLQDL